MESKLGPLYPFKCTQPNTKNCTVSKDPIFFNSSNSGYWPPMYLGTFEPFLTNTPIGFVALILDVSSISNYSYKMPNTTNKIRSVEFSFGLIGVWG